MDIKTIGKERIAADTTGQKVDGIAWHREGQNAINTVFHQGMVDVYVGVFIGIAIHRIHLDLIWSIVIEDGIEDIHLSIHHQRVSITLIAGKGAVGEIHIRIVSRSNNYDATWR